MVTVNVLFYGPARSLSRRASIQVSLGLGPATLAGVRRAVGEACPELRTSLSTWRWAVNHTFVSEDSLIQDGDEVALIPPVSGG